MLNRAKETTDNVDKYKKYSQNGYKIIQAVIIHLQTQVIMNRRHYLKT